MAKKKEFTGLIIKIDRKVRSKLRTLQANYELIGEDKTLAQVAEECVEIGIESKLEQKKTL